MINLLRKTKYFRFCRIEYIFSDKKDQIIEKNTEDGYEIIDKKYDETNVPGM